MRLDEFLARDFWLAVESNADHVLLEMAGAGDASMKRILCARLRNKPRPLDLDTCFNYLSAELAGSQN